MTERLEPRSTPPRFAPNRARPSSEVARTPLLSKASTRTKSPATNGSTPQDTVFRLDTGFVSERIGVVATVGNLDASWQTERKAERYPGKSGRRRCRYSVAAPPPPPDEAGVLTFSVSVSWSALLWFSARDRRESPDGRQHVNAQKRHERPVLKIALNASALNRSGFS